MRYDGSRVEAYTREAKTDELLDRVTVYRAGMEPEAVEVIEAELHRRGCGRERIEAHAARRAEAITDVDGVAVRCTHCELPAVVSRWGWRYWSLMIWGRRRPLLPVFRRQSFYCEKHLDAVDFRSGPTPP